MREKRPEKTLEQILEICASVEEGRDPFVVDVKKNLSLLSELLPKWTRPRELVLDAEAVASISQVVYRQGESVAREASALYIDPELVIEKTKRASIKSLASVFIASWRRIASVEQLSRARLEEAILYYTRLPPMKERFHLLGRIPRTSVSAISLDDLLKLEVFSEEEFREALERLGIEIGKRAGEKGVDYHEFISGQTPQETALRAYLLSFLLTEGIVNLEVDPLQGILTLRAGPPKVLGPPRSLAIPVDLRARAS